MASAAGYWLVGACLLGNPPADTEPRYEFRQIQMGVPVQIVLYAADEAVANRAAAAAFARIEQLNGILSDYDGDSELRRLCRSSGPDRPVPVSPELFFVLSRSVSLSEQTDGAFDVTVGPVVKLWRRARRRKKMPDADHLADALKRVGYRAIRLDPDSRQVELGMTSMRLDLGGIAKGYAADEALRVLKAHGVQRAMIDAGGDIVTGDAPPGEPGWRIGIASIEDPDAAPNRFMPLANAAVATSGDAYQSVTIDGTRYSHIVDPKTGLGLTRRSSVTVVAADGITADSLASAVSVLGPERGRKLVETYADAAVLVVELRNGSPVHTLSPTMKLLDSGELK